MSRRKTFLQTLFEAKRISHMTIYALFINLIYISHLILYIIWDVNVYIPLLLVCIGLTVFIQILFTIILPAVKNGEILVSLLFLLYISINYLTSGGFFVNNAISVLGFVVIVESIGFYNIRKKRNIVRAITYGIIISMPMIISFFLSSTNPSFFNDLLGIRPILKSQLNEILYSTNIIFVMISIFYILLNIHAVNSQLSNRISQLIFDVLPETIAQEIFYNNTKIPTEHYENVTVLVADIEGFTKLSTNISPTKIVLFLNTLFSEFDEIAKKYNLQKIRTVGDAYLVASGIYGPNEPQKTVEFAKQMLALTKKIEVEPGKTINIRIGVHSSDFYGGILGGRYFYDVWGDSIRKAEEIEEESPSNCVSVSKEVKKTLENYYSFEEHQYTTLSGERGVLYTVVS